MTWFDWTLIGLWSLSLVLQPLQVNKPRKPKSEQDAIVGAVMALALIAGLLVVRGVL